MRSVTSFLVFTLAFFKLKGVTRLGTMIGSHLVHRYGLVSSSRRRLTTFLQLHRTAVVIRCTPTTEHRGTACAATESSQSRFSSTSSARRVGDSSDAAENRDKDAGVTFHPVYVHQISKIVLEHLQDAHGMWLVEQELDRGLRLNTNGTFVLQFEPRKRGFDAGRIW